MVNPVYPTIKNRPLGMLSANGETIYDSVDFLARQLTYSGSNPQYVGAARVGSLTSAPVWQIFKMTYSAGNLVSITWPQINGVASSDFQFIFDNASSYTYS